TGASPSERQDDREPAGTLGGSFGITIDGHASAVDANDGLPPGARHESFRTEAVQGSIDVRQGQHTASPPHGFPEAPVDGRALLGLRRLEPLVGDLLLEGETLVLRVRLLVTDVEAVAAVRVGIADARQ